MNTNQSRIYEIDSLRAWLMLLGVFYHGIYFSYSYVERDPLSKWAFFIISEFIHSFRMPLFFVISGFLTYLYYEKRGVRLTLINRFKRIVIPFAGAMVFLMPVKQFASKVYTSVEGGNSVLFSIGNHLSIDGFLPMSTDYLWFLCYLAWFVTFFLLACLFVEKIQVDAKKMVMVFIKLMSSVLKRTTFFVIVTLLFFLVTKSYGYRAAASLVPELLSFTIYFSYFLLGAFIYKSHIELKVFSKCIWQQLILAVMLTIAKRYLLSKAVGPNFPFLDEIILVLSVTTTYLMLFGVLGLFFKNFKTYSATSRYLSKASYWVYLFHLVIMPLIPLALLDLHLHPLVVYTSTVAITYVLCMVSYHYFVRSSIIGIVLNGRIKTTNKSQLSSASINNADKASEINDLSAVPGLLYEAQAPASISQSGKM